MKLTYQIDKFNCETGLSVVMAAFISISRKIGHSLQVCMIGEG